MKTKKEKLPTIAIAPDGCCNYLTPGKEYLITDFWDEKDVEFGYCFNIEDNDGLILHCLEFGCEFLNGKSWSLK